MGRYSGKTCRLIFMLVITFIFFVAEIVAGYMGNSIALVSDSFNMLSDIISLCVGLTASYVSRRAGSGRSTYGWVRAEVVGALANAVFLAALCFSVSVEALKRLVRPEAIDDPGLVLVVGALGLAVNVVGLLIFQDCRRCCSRMKRAEPPAKSEDGHDMNGVAGSSMLHDEGDQPKEEGQPLNIRGVLLHVLNDALGSVVVVVASALFYVWPLAPEDPCNWQCYVDPSLTLVMVTIIMCSAAPLVRETSSMLLQMSPADLNLTALMEEVCAVPGVLAIHDVHVWELCKGRLVATLHARCSPDHQGGAALSLLTLQIRQIFHQAGVHSLTLQPEFGEPQPGSKGVCAAPCPEASCLKLSCCSPGRTESTAVNSNGHAPTSTTTRLTEVSVEMAESTKALLRERAGAGAGAGKNIQSTEM